MPQLDYLKALSKENRISEQAFNRITWENAQRLLWEN